MQIILFIVVAFLAWFVGVWGFAQIIGSLQNIKTRGIGKTLFTIIVWAAILILGWILMHSFAPNQSLAYYIATAIAFLQILLSGKIK